MTHYETLIQKALDDADSRDFKAWLRAQERAHIETLRRAFVMKRRAIIQAAVRS